MGGNYGGAIPIDGAASTAGPLPSGAATETTIASIDAKTPALVGGAVPMALKGYTWNPATCSQSN